MQDSKKKKSAAIETIKPAEIKNGQLILTDKHKKLIKEQIAPNATPEELQLFLMMAHRTRLDPLLKQLYFIKYGRGDRAKVSYVTSIDGYRIIAHRTGQFAGIDEPRYTLNNSEQLVSCTITVYRKDSERGFSATVYFKEYNTSQNLWAKMPMTMIAKVAEAHALRKAFPQDLSGVYTTDEMDQASMPVKTVSATATRPTQPSQTVRPKAGPGGVSPAQVKYIHSLLKQKNKSADVIYQTYKIKSLNDLNKTQASAIIDRLMNLTVEAPAAVVEGEISEADVDPDEVIEGMAAQEKDLSPRATAGQVRLLEILIDKKAKQDKKSYSGEYNAIVKKYNVDRLNYLSQNQVKEITDEITKQNYKTKLDAEDQEIIDTVGEQ